MEKENPEVVGADQHEASIDPDRREALVKMGTFAAFTVPMVSTLLVSKKASALSCTVEVGGDPTVEIECRL